MSGTTLVSDESQIAPRRRLHLRRPAHDRAGADAHFLGRDVLPLRVPGDLDRAVRTERQRRLRLRARAASSIGCRPDRCWRRSRWSTRRRTIVALFVLVRLRVGLNYSPQNLALMLTIYALAALPFFTGGLVITLAISRLSSRINAVYAADLLGAAAGCLVLIPLLNRLGAPGVVLAAAALARRGRRPVRAAAPDAPRTALLGAAILARAARRPALRARRLRRHRHQGAPGRPRALQQVEFVLAHRRLRARARRLVAEPRLHRAAARHALHGHRLGGVDADSAASRPTCRTRSTCATSSPRWRTT